MQADTPTPRPPLDGKPTAAWVPTTVAAKRLGISTSTLERRIKGYRSGERFIPPSIPSEQYRRDQGSDQRSYYLVYAPEEPGPMIPQESPQPGPERPQEAPASPQEAPSLDLAPLVQLLERERERVVTLATELGGVRVQLAIQDELIDELRAQLALSRQAQLLAEASGALAEARNGDLTQAIMALGEQARRQERSWWAHLPRWAWGWLQWRGAVLGRPGSD